MKMLLRNIPVLMLVVLLSNVLQAQIKTSAALMKAINEGNPNDEIIIAAGEFIISEPLVPKEGMKIRGAGACKTIIKPIDSWSPGMAGLPDGDVVPKNINRQAFLISFEDKTRNVEISDLKLMGYKLHGVIHGYKCDSLDLHDVIIEGSLHASIRIFASVNLKIHDNTFINAGGKIYFNDRKNNVSGGALFLTWVSGSEFWNNHIYKTPDYENSFFGFKGRQAKTSRFHHNTVEVSFSFEYPFENDHTVEIDHNYFVGVMSIPKHGGGPFPTDGYTFHIHHNWVGRSYAIEFTRNAVEVDHNLFDFDPLKDDGGNLISSFGSVAMEGPTKFHDNLIKNPGRGIAWMNGVSNNFAFYNNHVIANKTITPRKDGLFGFNAKNDFSTVVIKDNIFEVIGMDRPLMRNDSSYNAIISNNKMSGISDIAKFQNPQTKAKQGLIEPLSFKCGNNDEFEVSGWDLKRLRTVDKEKKGCENALSIREPNTLFDILLEPNPAKNWVNINLGMIVTGCKVKIISLTGKLILEESFQNVSSAILSLENIASGNYILKVDANNLSSSKNLIIE